MSAACSKLDWCRDDPAYAHVPKTFRSSGRHGFTLVSGLQPAGFYQRPAADEFALQCVRLRCSTVVDHGKKFVAVSDGLGLSPTGTDLSYDAAGELACLVGVLPRAAVRTLVSASTGRSWNGDFGRLHAMMFEDAAVEALLGRLWDEAKENSPHGALFADSAWTTLLLALLSAAGERFQPVPVRGGLAGWQERRATEYLVSHMAEDVTLDALAGAADLSTFYFAPQFKQSTNLPSHAYLRRLRCERAKELLTHTDLLVAEVAAQVGYETPQAFARMFRAEAGASPSEYRREWRS